MSYSIHILSTSSILGFVETDGKCRSSKRVAVSSLSCNGGRQFSGSANVVLKSFPVRSPRRISFACNAGPNNPNNYRKNPDFSRQNKGSSEGKNRYQGRENSGDNEQNGSLLSISNNSNHSDTATPGPNEKEIVELFRKAQAQLRERGAIKGEKKIEASPQGQGDSGGVDSLLKLLRNHTHTQGKKSGGGEEINLDQPERSNTSDEEQNSSFFSTSKISMVEEVRYPDPVPLRPASSFRRKSPVPRVNFQAVFSAEEGSSSGSSLKSQAKKEKGFDEIEPELVALEESSKLSSHRSDVNEIKKDNLEASVMEGAELASLKLSELKGIAKARGLKGYSKLKKTDVALEESSEMSSGESDVDETKEDNIEASVMEGVELASLKLLELRGIAKARGLKGYSKLKKSDLVELLTEDGS